MDKKRYAGVIVKHKDKILFCKRNNQGSDPGQWSIPGGKMEPDEEPSKTAKREFYEEMGVDIDNQNIEFIGMLPRYSRDGTKLKGQMHVFGLETDNLIQPDLENAIDGEEHTECGYFKVGETPDIGSELMSVVKKFI